MRDAVKCCNCGFVGTVEMGAEICPACQMTGALAWQDDNQQEVK